MKLAKDLVVGSGIEFIEPSDRISGVIRDFIGAIKSGRRLT